MSQYGDLEFVGQLIGVYPVHIYTVYQDLIYTLNFATSPPFVLCYSRNMDLTTPSSNALSKIALCLHIGSL